MRNFLSRAALTPTSDRRWLSGVRYFHVGTMESFQFWEIRWAFHENSSIIKKFSSKLLMKNLFSDNFLNSWLIWIELQKFINNPIHIHVLNFHSSLAFP